MINERDPNTAEDRATTGGYPQINLNTGVSISAVALLIGMVIWSIGIKNDVSYHADRIAALELGYKELRTAGENFRETRAQSETKLEGRLVAIEGLLRDVISRLAMSDRRK